MSEYRKILKRDREGILFYVQDHPNPYVKYIIQNTQFFIHYKKIDETTRKYKYHDINFWVPDFVETSKEFKKQMTYQCSFRGRTEKIKEGLVEIRKKAEEFFENKTLYPEFNPPLSEEQKRNFHSRFSLNSEYNMNQFMLERHYQLNMNLSRGQYETKFNDFCI